MELHFLIPNPVAFDILVPPTPFVSRGRRVTVIFEVINRSPRPLRHQRLFLLAKDELCGLLAFDQVELAHLAPGETFPVRLSLRVDVNVVGLLVLQLAAEPHGMEPLPQLTNLAP